MAGEFTSSTFYDDVRVPAANLVGEENGGWTLITNQLNFERVAICPVSGILRSIAEVRAWAQETRLADGRRVVDQEWVQVHLARLWARAEYLKLINWKVAWAADKGLNPADASATKVYGSEFALEAYRVLLEIVGQAGYLAAGHRVPWCTATSSTGPGARPSSPSAAAPTRSSATSSPGSGSGCPGPNAEGTTGRGAPRPTRSAVPGPPSAYTPRDAAADRTAARRRGVPMAVAAVKRSDGPGRRGDHRL